MVARRPNRTMPVDPAAVAAAAAQEEAHWGALQNPATEFKFGFEAEAGA